MGNKARIAKFEKVSLEQFTKDFNNCWGSSYATTDEVIKNLYNNIKLPTRSTSGSAGYDFYIAQSVIVNPMAESHKKGVTIPTGIRCQIQDSWVLMLFPRSGLGFKHGTKLRNTVGIIDADYYNSDNEGHIMAKITTDDNLVLQAGDRFMQGIFIPYGLTVDDEANGVRNGGFGSTGE